MIKTNELRIGNWINHKNENGSFNLVVKEIEDKNVGVIYKGGNWSIGYEYINPIPLTPEILEKCGFEFIKNITEWANITEDYSYWKLKGIEIFGDKSCNKTNILIEYLHQLQNLYFALTGEELAISYEKVNNLSL